MADSDPKDDSKTEAKVQVKEHATFSAATCPDKLHAIGKALESLRLESDSSGTNTDEVGADLSSLVSKPSPKSADSGEKDLKNINDETLSSIVDLIKSDKCKNVIFMVGAGISTSAGIPDFRSEGTGLFNNLQKYKLPTPEAIFMIQFFMKNPKPFFQLSREIFPGKYNPTPTHYFMKLFNDKKKLKRIYSQNIDSLERMAGIPDNKLVEAHGTFNTGHCVKRSCKQEYSLEWMKKIVLDASLKDNVPRCSKCNSYVKPDIVFYGEMLPDKFYHLSQIDFSECDLLIVMGTSLLVEPFAGLMDKLPKDVPRLIVNNEVPKGYQKGISSRKDVFLFTNADDACLKLAQLIGWGDDLKKMIDESKPNAE